MTCSQASIFLIKNIQNQINDSKLSSKDDAFKSFISQFTEIKIRFIW